jgi:hypothetical protein
MGTEELTCHYQSSVLFYRNQHESVASDHYFLALIVRIKERE